MSDGCVQLCCCECPLDLGCVDACSTLKTQQIAAKDGLYSLIYKFNGNWTTLPGVQFSINDELNFDISDLVPNYVYEAQIIDPDNEYICPEDDLMEYDCMRFKLVLTLNHN